MCLHNFSGAFFFKFFYLISQQFLSKKNFFLLICNPLLVMCIWYKCSILLMIFIFWSIHGYYIRKEKNLCFSGVCQPNQKLFIDYLPVWGNSNLTFSQCLWCISSYGCWLLWALCSRCNHFRRQKKKKLYEWSLIYFIIFSVYFSWLDLKSHHIELVDSDITACFFFKIFF